MVSRVSRRRRGNSEHLALRLAQGNPRLQYRNVSIAKQNRHRRLGNPRLGLTWIGHLTLDVLREGTWRQLKGSELEYRRESGYTVPLEVGDQSEVR